MKKLKSLEVFEKENKNLKLASSKEIRGGIYASFKTYSRDTCDNGHDDCCSVTVGDGMFGTNC